MNRIYIPCLSISPTDFVKLVAPGNTWPGFPNIAHPLRGNRKRAKRIPWVSILSDSIIALSICPSWNATPALGEWQRQNLGCPSPQLGSGTGKKATLCWLTGGYGSWRICKGAVGVDGKETPTRVTIGPHRKDGIGHLETVHGGHNHRGFSGWKQGWRNPTIRCDLARQLVHE